jgi:hypothetical protein
MTHVSVTPRRHLTDGSRTSSDTDPRTLLSRAAGEAVTASNMDSKESAHRSVRTLM